MEQIINTIIEAEKKAQAILDEAKKLKEELPGCIQCDANALNGRYIAKEKARLEKVKESEKAFFDEAVISLNEKKDNEINRLQEIFNNNCDSWVDSLYNRILGR